jgi:hypothetical protein
VGPDAVQGLHLARDNLTRRDEGGHRVLLGAERFWEAGTNQTL